MNKSKIQAGSIVSASAGRDCGGFFAVVSAENGYCFIADGKSRKLAKPKRKNIKHIRLTNSMIDPKDLSELTDKKLRTILREYASRVKESGCTE